MVSAGSSKPRIAVLGASGLIGHSLAAILYGQGWPVVAVARRIEPSQRFSLGPIVLSPVVDLTEDALTALLRAEDVDIVVNCIGILQDGPAGRSDDVHQTFVARLAAAAGGLSEPVLVVHLSVPGDPADDATAFSRTKRLAEQALDGAGIPHAILRPGFVVAPAAYGGSALIRALAALPVDLPRNEGDRPFQCIGVADIARTVAWLAERWSTGERSLGVSWDLMHPQAETVASVVDTFRRWSGGRHSLRRLMLPRALLDLGALAGDVAGRLGWRPPIRSTALAEMRRGVAGDPGPWMAATGIEPRSLTDILSAMPATIQEKWFARLYFLKPVLVATLAAFWIVSGLIALTVSFGTARGILVDAGLAGGPATLLTTVTSLADIAVGLAVATRRTHRAGLVCGLAISLGYLAAATLLAPALWLDPIGALVKVVPAIVLMLVALAVSDER